MISENGNTNQLNNKNEQYSKKLAIIFIVAIGIMILSWLLMDHEVYVDNMSSLDFMMMMMFLVHYIVAMITRHYVI